MSEDITRETRAHIREVARRLDRAILDLSDRAMTHDDSKLESPEAEGFWEMNQISARKDVEYGSPEYKALMDSQKPVIEHHYSENDHHPKYWRTHTSAAEVPGDLISCMNLMSLIEMVCDWDAAASRYKDGSFSKSFGKNCERFGISPQLACILRNTAVELGFMSRTDIPESY